jgi:hypothetical protein
LVQNEPDSEITEDSNSRFGGWIVTYTDPHPIQLEQQESDSTAEDVTPSSSVDETPPVNADSSKSNCLTYDVSTTLLEEFALNFVQDWFLGQQLLLLIVQISLGLSSHEHLLCLQQQISAN